MATKVREARRSARQRQQQQTRAIAFALIGILVLSLAGYLLVSAFVKPKPTPMAGNVIDVAASMSGFDMKEMHVKVGEAVTIRLTSLDNSHHTDGGGKHQWAVDELGVNIIAPPEGSNYATFTPDKPGEYAYYCDICCGGRANPTMQGMLIVEA